MLFKIGVDEAGRGPVLGPMVMAALLLREVDEKELLIKGVKDSKDLSKKKREELFSFLTKNFLFEKVIIPPREIDEAVGNKKDSLNLLEARYTAKLIISLLTKLKINSIDDLLIIIDCPSANINKYRDYIIKLILKEKKLLFNIKNKILCEYKADKNHVVVGAASIIAKVIRDKELERISSLLNKDIGSGYPSDEKTKLWLENNYDKDYGFIRRSWASVKNIEKSKEQRRLFEFKNHDIIRSFEPLLNYGFVFEEPKNNELLRLKGDGVFIIKYKTGTLLIQGKPEKKKEVIALLQALNIN